MNKEERLAKLKSVMKGINKTQGKVVLNFADSEGEWERVSSGIKELDDMIGGGFPYGHTSIVWGGTGCLTGDTIIEYCSKTKNGNLKDKKNKSLKRLYQNFNNISVKGSGKYIRKELLGCEYYAMSVDENNKILKNKIENVIYSGKKEVYKLSTAMDGILSTKDHKFLTRHGYEKLENLKIGDEIYYSPNDYFGEKQKRMYRKEVCIKYHPFGNKKIINKCLYYRIPYSHLVYEANMNNMSVRDYRWLLNSGTKTQINTLKFIDKRKYEVHHKDKKPSNDDIVNLQLLGKKEHHGLHDNLYLTKREAKLTKIASIVKIGTQDTYDIQMASPYNNFIANRLVVHNSGKSTLMYSVVAQAQKDDKIVAFLDLENSFDNDRASKMGVKVDELIIGHYAIAEQALDTINIMAKESVVDVIILDSIHSMAPKGAVEDKKGDKSLETNTMGLLANKLSQFFARASTHVFEANIALIMIGQTRKGLGGFIVLDTLTGGNALIHNSVLTLHQRRGQKANAPHLECKVAFLDPDGKFHLQKEKTQDGFETVIKIDKKKCSGGCNEGTDISLPYHYDTGFIVPNTEDTEIKIDPKMNEEQVKIIKEKLVAKGYEQFAEQVFVDGDGNILEESKEYTVEGDTAILEQLEEIVEEKPKKKRGRPAKKDKK